MVTFGKSYLTGFSQKLSCPFCNFVFYCAAPQYTWLCTLLRAVADARHQETLIRVINDVDNLKGSTFALSSLQGSRPCFASSMIQIVKKFLASYALYHVPFSSTAANRIEGIRIGCMEVSIIYLLIEVSNMKNIFRSKCSKH